MSNEQIIDRHISEWRELLKRPDLLTRNGPDRVRTSIRALLAVKDEIARNGN